MRWYRVYASSLSQIPNLASIILTRRRYVKTVWREIDTEDGRQMTFHKHYASAGTQIPYSAKRVLTACGANASIALKAK